MASKPQEFTSTCLICYESRPLKIVGNCKHSFCIECLSTVFESLDSGTEVFACPTCKVDCPRPWDGLKGLVDFTGNTDNVGDTNTERGTGPEEKETQGKGGETQVDVICDVCNDREIKVKVANTCPECHNLHICTDCSEAHSKNKATCHHLLIPWVSKIKEEAMMCKVHHKILITFCCTCGVQACSVCVSAQHGDHEVEGLGEAIRHRLDTHESKLMEMLELQRELTFLKTIAPTVDKQDTLIKEIEDHAQRCIDQTVKWKEDLKKQVKLDYKILRDIPHCLEGVSEEVQNLERQIKRANQLLSGTKHCSFYPDIVQQMQKALEDIARTGKDLKGRQFRNKLFNLNSDDPSFAPGPSIEGSSFGKVVKIPKSGIFHFKLISQHKMHVDSKNKSIPCVAVLGPKYYAVAHPVIPGEPAEAIDIYEFPRTWTTTLKDHVPPLYAMAATPDGKIAVLSKGKVDNTSRVKLFDPEAGYTSSTRDIAVTAPLSLGVTLLQQYVILGENDQGQKEITVADKNGDLEHKHVIHDQDVDNIYSCTRITCGGRFIFIMGYQRVVVYEILDTGLKKITCPPIGIAKGRLKDISATIWDNLILTNVDSWSGVKFQDVYITTCTIQDKEQELEWGGLKPLVENKGWSKVSGQIRVSTRDGRTVVMSHDKTIMVYKCD